MSGSPVAAPRGAWRRARAFAGRGPALRLVVGGVIVALVVLSLRRIEGARLVASVRSANPWLVALATILQAPLVLVKALRLPLLVDDAAGARLPVGARVRLYLASYAADNLSFSQAGLGVRALALHAGGVALGAAVASQALEKLLEGATLLWLVPLALTAADRARLQALLASSSTPRGVVVVVVALVALAAVARARGAIGRSLSRWRSARAVIDGARRLASPRRSAAAFALSGFAWAIELAIVLAVLAAVHVAPRIDAAARVLVAVSFAALLPGLPGNLGGFEAAAAFALGATAPSPASALGFALVYHAVHTLPATALGAPALRRFAAAAAARAA